jgi:ferric-dicitrate binding protein FerR (iron transport regulator)
MRRALPCLIALASCVPVLAEQVGEIVFIDGRVEVLRNEQTLTEADLAVGAPIENLDRVSTGEGAQVTIAITAPYGAPAEIRIAAKTTFYVEIERMERRSATTLGLITGSIGLKVQKLGGNRSLAVRTDTTVMGVRGTTFDVTTSPAGDVLVSAQEGSVTCSDAERGEEIVAEPGEVVERRVEEDTFRSVPVAVSTLEQFRREWVAERIAILRATVRPASRPVQRCL